jgi:ABC-type multidrug transport system permease subunit
MAALSEPARPFLLGAGAPARLARDLRYRVPFRARRLDHPYVSYAVYIAPGLIAMILMFNGMLSSLSMVYDREWEACGF